MKTFVTLAAIAVVSAVNIQREPLLTWKQKVPATHPMDYPMPSWGADPEIEASLKNSEKLAAKDYSGEEFHVDKKFKLFPTMKYPATEEFTE